MRDVQTEGMAEHEELAERLALVAQASNQGEDYRLEKNWLLYVLGVAVPLILMWAGWYW